jgi:hypothetical protein
MPAAKKRVLKKAVAKKVIKKSSCSTRGKK